jgi:hypothetical protein
VKIRRNVVWLAVAVIAILAFWLRVIHGYTQIVKLIASDEAYAIDRVEYAGGAAQVLASGRLLIDEFGIDQEGCREVSTNDLRVPVHVQRLDPLSIHVFSDMACIVLKGDGRRAYLMVYAAHARQSGTRLICDGLWFWNGDDRVQGARLDF